MAGGPPNKQYAAPDYDNVTDALAGLYAKKVAPLEKDLLFPEFATACKTPAECKAKPMVLLLGQYSVGKTTFVKYLIGKDYPGCLIGPEPTTEAFTAVSRAAGDQDCSVPGSSAIADASRPWGSLAVHGDGLAQRFSCSSVAKGTSLLDDVDLVDTPGVLAGSKQTHDRKYDFERVVMWFAERADLILVLLDTSKLDMSDEFMNLLRTLQLYDEKMRIVLNKSDQVSNAELLRVMQAASWNLAKTLRTPEVKRTYVSSWTQDPPIQNSPLKAHFEKERDLLSEDIQGLTKGKKQRRVNEFIRRTRHAVHHGRILGHLKATAPMVGNKAEWEKRTLENMDLEFSKVAVKYKVERHELPMAAAYVRQFKTNAVSLLKLPASCDAKAQKLLDVLDVDVKNTLSHFRHELDGVAFTHQKPEAYRGILLKAGNKNKFGLGGGFRKRFVVVDAEGILKYYDKDPAIAPDASKVPMKGEIDLAGAAAKALPAQNQSFCFAISGPRCARDYIIAATSAEDMSTWMRLIDAFGAAIDPASRKDPAPMDRADSTIVGPGGDDDETVDG